MNRHHRSKIDQIIRQKPSNGLPEWVKERAAVRGYGDALEPLSLIVNEDDIDKAFASAAHGDGSECVMAQAGQRLGAEEVYFYRTTVWVDFGVGPIRRFVTSKAIYNNIIEPFDRGDREAIAPGIYHITPPCDSQSLRRREKKSKKKAPKRTRKGSKQQLVYHTERVVRAGQI
jgi:hypothetical protein